MNDCPIFMNKMMSSELSLRSEMLGVTSAGFIENIGSSQNPMQML